MFHGDIVMLVANSPDIKGLFTQRILCLEVIYQICHIYVFYDIHKVLNVFISTFTEPVFTTPAFFFFFECFLLRLLLLFLLLRSIRFLLRLVFFIANNRSIESV